MFLILSSQRQWYYYLVSVKRTLWLSIKPVCISGPALPLMLFLVLMPDSSHINPHLQGCSSPPTSSIIQSFTIQYLQPLSLAPSLHFHHILPHSNTVPIFNILHVLVVSPQPSCLRTQCPQITLFHHPCPFTALHRPVISQPKDTFNLIIPDNYSHQ